MGHRLLVLVGFSYKQEKFWVVRNYFFKDERVTKSGLDRVKGSLLMYW